MLACPAEVYGLELDDVSFERRTVTFRPNAWRRLKMRGSRRVVPLTPQLEEILRDYLRGPDRPTGELLFPSLATRREAILTDTRKLINHVAERARWKEGEIRTKMFRHTYCAARLQTLDAGAPVSIYTVSREVGHKSTAMVERIYGHLGTIRHRSEVLEYRVEQHEKTLADRLKVLRAAETEAKAA
jgi:integrase